MDFSERTTLFFIELKKGDSRSFRLARQKKKLGRFTSISTLTLRLEGSWPKFPITRFSLLSFIYTMCLILIFY